MLELLEPRLSRGAIVVADMSPGDPHHDAYREHVSGRYPTVEVPIDAGWSSPRSSITGLTRPASINTLSALKRDAARRDSKYCGRDKPGPGSRLKGAPAGPMSGVSQ